MDLLRQISPQEASSNVSFPLLGGIELRGKESEGGEVSQYRRKRGGVASE